jgi:hypothetical protein
MSTSFTVSLTDTQKKTMDYWMEDIQGFLDNITNENIRRASDEIVAKLVDHCNANEIQLATGKDAQVEQAFTLEVVTTAKVRKEQEQAPE